MVTPFKDMTQPELREYFNRLARHVERMLPSGPGPRGKALFCMLVFDDSCIGQYVSNAKRVDIIKSMREFADSLESKEDIER